VLPDTRAVSRFSAIELRGIGRVVLTRGEQEGVTIEAEDNLLPEISSTVNDDTLVLELQNGTATKPIIYRVTARQVTALSSRGAGDIEAPGLSLARLLTRQDGTGTIRLDQLTAQELESTLSGAGGLEASGTVTTLKVTITGAGKLNGRELVARDAELSLTGAGDAVVRVSNTLRVRASGAGKVEYIGNPRVDSDVTGASTVRRIDGGSAR
jgi:hypothetical protein